MAVNTFTGAFNSNWSNLLNWSTGAVPTAADGNVATFDAASPNCTVDGSNRVCNNIDFTNYPNTSTITMSFNITVGTPGTGNITLGANMVVAGTGILACVATGTLTSNGKTWPNGFSISGSGQTMTLADSWTVNGTFTGPSSGTLTLNNSGGAQTLTLKGSSTFVTNAAILTGSATIIVGGSGNQTLTCAASAGGALKNNFQINSSGGTVTFAAGQNFRYNTGTFTDTAGVIDASAAGLLCELSTTYAISGITWGSGITLNGSGATHTLNENLNTSSLLSLGSTTQAVAVNGNTINCASIRHAGTSGSITGTTVLNVNTGGGTLDGPSVSTGRVDLPLTINNSGTTTIAATYFTKLDQVLLAAGVVSAVRGAWASGGSSGGGSVAVVGPGVAR